MQWTTFRPSLPRNELQLLIVVAVSEWGQVMRAFAAIVVHRLIAHCNRCIWEPVAARHNNIVCLQFNQVNNGTPLWSSYTSSGISENQDYLLTCTYCPLAGRLLCPPLIAVISDYTKKITQHKACSKFTARTSLTLGKCPTRANEKKNDIKPMKMMTTIQPGSRFIH